MKLISYSDIGKCYLFAHKVTQQNIKRYKRRKIDVTIEKVTHDHFIAKITEIYIYNYLTHRKYKCTYPDFSIDANKEKYKDDVDMVVEKDGKKLKLHIKTCRVNSFINKSWLIQKDTYTVKSPTDLDFFVFCTYNSPDNIVIESIINSKIVKWKDPVNSMPSKYAAYLNDLVK